MSDAVLGEWSTAYLFVRRCSSILFSGPHQVLSGTLLFGVWAAPATRKPLPKVGHEAPHLLEGVSGPPGPPRPQKSTISGRPKNHVLKIVGHPRAEATPMMRRPARDLSSVGGGGGSGGPFVWPSATHKHPQTPPPPMMRGPWKGRPVGVPSQTPTHSLAPKTAE